MTLLFSWHQRCMTQGTTFSPELSTAGHPSYRSHELSISPSHSYTRSHQHRPPPTPIPENQLLGSKLKITRDLLVLWQTLHLHCGKCWITIISPNNFLLVKTLQSVYLPQLSIVADRWIVSALQNLLQERSPLVQDVQNRDE